MGWANSPRRILGPTYIQNHIKTIMEFAGFDPDSKEKPEIEQWDVALEFDLSPSQTSTQSLPAKDRNWIMVERRAVARAVVEGALDTQFPVPGLITVSSFIVSETGVNVVLSEESPLTLGFGSGEWQRSNAVDRSSEVNVRIFSVTNLSEVRAIVTLSFKMIGIRRTFGVVAESEESESEEIIQEA